MCKTTEQDIGMPAASWTVDPNWNSALNVSIILGELLGRVAGILIQIYNVQAPALSLYIDRVRLKTSQ